METLRRLAVGERVRFTPGGPLYVVDRVSPCAAYVHKVYDPPVSREFVDPLTKEVRRMLVSRGPAEPGISPCSFVIRDEAGV